MKRFGRFMSCFLALLAVTAAGCSSGGGGASSSPAAEGAAPAAGTSPAANEPYKVYFYAWSSQQTVQPLVDAFNKDYAGQYELVYQKLSDAATMTINTALASGEQIDVMTQSSAIDLRQRADAGTYMGLQSFLNQDGLDYKELFGDSIEAVQNFDGDYYSLPYCKNINMVWFNKNMFKEAGIDFPKPEWTWDDFREIAKKMTHGEGAAKVYGAMLDFAGPRDNGGGDQYWDLIARQKLGAFVHYAPDFQTTRFNAPEMKESLQFFYGMVMTDRSIVPLDELTALKYQDDTNGMNGLYNGKFAMWVAPVYASGYLDKQYGEVPEGTDIGMTNMPRPAGWDHSVTTCYTSTASIPSNSKNPEASWTLLKYICLEHPELFAGLKSMHPPYDFKTKEEADRFNEIIFNGHPGLDKEMAMEVMALDRELVTKDNSHIEGQAKINDLIFADMSLVFNGEMSVDDALADLQAKGDQYIQEDSK